MVSQDPAEQNTPSSPIRSLNTFSVFSPFGCSGNPLPAHGMEHCISAYDILI